MLPLMLKETETTKTNKIYQQSLQNFAVFQDQFLQLGVVLGAITFLESKYKTTSILLGVELQGDENKNSKMIFHRCNMLNLKMIFYRCNMLPQHITSMKNHFRMFVFVALELNTEQDGCRLVFTLQKCYCSKDNSKLKKLILKNCKVLETLLVYFIRLCGFSLF